MACVTLKRSLEFDPLHGSGSSYSPRPHKRRRCMPMRSVGESVFKTHHQSVFLGATSALSPEEIARNVREQIRILKRRKMIQERSMEYEGYESPTSPPGSPPGLAMLGPESPKSSLNNQTLPSSSSITKDKPLFTMRQVNMICEQLVKEREVHIREDYEKILSNKLAEQYDCFVRFTTDQIQQRLSQAELPSYLS